MNRATFQEVEQVADQNEEYAQGRVDQLIRLHLEVHGAELENVQSQRAEERDIREQALAQIREGLMQQFQIGVLAIRIQRVAAETRNRRVVNAMIIDVKTHSEDISRFSTNALEVLNATKDQYALISPSRKNTTRTHLTRVSEKLSTISLSLNNIEQILACFEFKDVIIAGICQQIKSQNSQFGGVVASLKSDMTAGEIGFRNLEDFKDFGRRLYQMVNCMQLISEERIAVIEAIEARHRETMPNIGNLGIQN